MADFKKQFGKEASHADCACNEKAGYKDAGSDVKREAKPEGHGKVQTQSEAKPAHKNIKS